MSSKLPASKALSHSARLALAVAVALPPLLLGALVWRWGVDVPVLDEWSLADDLAKWYAGDWRIADLLRSHNGHRLFFPRLILVPLAGLTGWNIRIEMALVALFAAGTLGVVSSALARALGGGREWGACLVLASLSIFSLNQWENWLWGFQVNVTMSVFFSLCALTQLAVRPGWSATARAALCAVVASFCQGSGMVVWPAGLLPILAGAGSARSRVLRALAWAAGGGIVVAAYLHPLPGDAAGPTPTSGYLLSHPLSYAAYVLTLLGAAAVSYSGSVLPRWDAGIAAPVAAAGIALMLGAVAALAERKPASLFPFLALLTYALWSLGVAAQIGLGRLGLNEAMAGRYMAFTTPFWLALAGLLAAVSQTRPAYRVGARVLFTALLLSLFWSSLSHLSRFELRFRLLQPALLELRKAEPSDEQLGILHPDVNQVRSRLPVLRQHRLSVLRDAAPLPPSPDLIFRDGFE